jgi:uncharacterized protein YyaL (SSP411 family)
MSETIPSHETFNRLADSKSPYLLQHADNPVAWHPWGEQAFEKAKKEDKSFFAGTYFPKHTRAGMPGFWKIMRLWCGD